jgi:hypothetical protein
MALGHEIVAESHQASAAALEPYVAKLDAGDKSEAVLRRVRHLTEMQSSAREFAEDAADLRSASSALRQGRGDQIEPSPVVSQTVEAVYGAAQGFASLPPIVPESTPGDGVKLEGVETTRVSFATLQAWHAAVSGVIREREQWVGDPEARWDRLQACRTALADLCNDFFPANWAGKSPSVALERDEEPGPPKLGKFCPACQAIPQAGYCNLAGCPLAPLPVPEDGGDEEGQAAWHFLPEDPVERRMFDAAVALLGNGNVLIGIASALTSYSQAQPQQGSFSRQLAIMSNACARLALSSPNGGEVEP